MKWTFLNKKFRDWLEEHFGKENKMEHGIDIKNILLHNRVEIGYKYASINGLMCCICSAYNGGGGKAYIKIMPKFICL